jgi:hypothetical protein
MIDPSAQKANAERNAGKTSKSSKQILVQLSDSVITPFRITVVIIRSISWLSGRGIYGRNGNGRWN